MDKVWTKIYCHFYFRGITLNLLVYHRNIFGSSSKVFGNLRKFSEIFGNFRKFTENVRERSSGLRNNFGKSSEIFGKWSEIFGTSSKTPCSHSYLTRSLRSLVQYRCEHSKINSISPRDHVLFSIYFSSCFDEAMAAAKLTMENCNILLR